MRIMQIVHNIPSRNIGGTEPYTIGLANSLKELGHDPIVVYPSICKGKKFNIRDEFFDDVHCVCIENDGRWATKASTQMINHEFNQIFAQVIEKYRPDIVHIQHLINFPQSIMDVLIKKGIPYVVSLHDFCFICPKSDLIRPVGQVCESSGMGVECPSCLIKKTKKMGLLSRSIEAFIHSGDSPDYMTDFCQLRSRYVVEKLNNSVKILAPSLFVKDRFVAEQVLESKIKVVPLGLPNLVPVPKNKNREFTFGFVGRLVKHKGIEVLISAFKNLVYPAKLLIYGEPVNNQYLSQLIKTCIGKNIEFKGKFTEKQLPEVFAGIDLLILPSIVPETYSFVIREAAMLETPVLASRIGAIPEFIKEESGMLFQPGNAAELKLRMTEILQGTDLFKSKVSRVTVPDFTQHARELNNIYNEQFFEGVSK